MKIMIINIWILSIIILIKLLKLLKFNIYSSIILHCQLILLSRTLWSSHNKLYNSKTTSFMIILLYKKNLMFFIQYFLDIYWNNLFLSSALTVYI